MEKINSSFLRLKLNTGKTKRNENKSTLTFTFAAIKFSHITGFPVFSLSDLIARELYFLFRINLTPFFALIPPGSNMSYYSLFILNESLVKNEVTGCVVKTILFLSKVALDFHSISLFSLLEKCREKLS